MVSAANDTNNSINNRNIPSYAKNPSVSSQTTPKLIEDNSTYKFYIIIFSLLLLFVLIALSICIAILVRKVKRRQKFNENGFPNPPWRLETSSRLILLEWVKVIVTKNPLVWRCSDREIIWLYDKRHPAYFDIKISIFNNQKFLTEHMLPLAINGKITMKENFLIAERIKSILSKEVVIMIGNEKVPSCVLPSLPHEVNDEYTYHYLTTYYSFKLEESNVMAPSTFKYVYGVVITKHKEKPIKQVVTVYYFRWKSLFITDNKVLRDKRRMPSEYDEILQLAMVYKPGETICISNRRKEVFSLLHMFYTFCYIMKEPIGFIDALQLHTEKCNGSMLDRDELLFVMAVIMEWAFQSDSLTDGLDESHREWCHSYAIMAAFMRKNPNIKLIHPDYLTKLDKDVKKSLLHDYFQSSPQFSERNSVASIDRFHRKNAYHSSIEKKECKNNKKSTIESKNKLSLSIKKEKQKKAEVISKNKVVEAEKKSKKFDDTEATQLSSLKYTVAVS